MDQTLPFEMSNSATNAQFNADPCTHLVHILMCYHQGGENPEFIRKAIESLVKKLKDRREQLDTLISAITSGGKQSTSCVTIHRSLDGRLQVAGRKGVPNVVYARIWRWPNVSKTELVKLPVCLTPTDHPDLICINPYHYDRIVSSGFRNLDYSSFNLNLLPSFEQTENYGVNHDEFQSTSSLTQQQPFHFNSNYQSCNNQQQPYRILSHLASENIATDEHNLYSKQHLQWSPSTPVFQEPLFQPNFNLKLTELLRLHVPPSYWCSITYFELDSQIGETFKVPWNVDEVLIDGGMNPAGVDTGRFCLGALSNVHRSEASERARLHIGKGVKLKHNRDDGRVFMECLSQKGVFVRSYFLDFQHGLQYGSAVHKFSFNAKRKVFDLIWAFNEMYEQKESAQITALVQAYAVAGVSTQSVPTILAGTGVDALRRACCTIALSFVKGWGAGYTRSNIKETPCWVEIQLHRPLQLLNELLRQTDT